MTSSLQGCAHRRVRTQLIQTPSGTQEQRSYVYLNDYKTLSQSSEIRAEGDYFAAERRKKALGSEESSCK